MWFGGQVQLNKKDRLIRWQSAASRLSDSIAARSPAAGALAVIAKAGMRLILGE